MNEFKLTISVPCFERPLRTIRIIECIASQTLNNWEAYIVGDGCSNIQQIIDSGKFVELQSQLLKKGNHLHIENLEKNYGGFGYEIINRNIQRARGEYLIFVSNDDYILENHFENYYQFMNINQHLDFAWFDTYLKFSEEIRESKLEFGSIGHAELIVKTEFIKNVSKHTSDYGHDWLFIKEMKSKSNNSLKASGKPPTYWVMGIPGNRETTID